MDHKEAAHMKRLVKAVAVVACMMLGTGALAADKKTERVWKAKCSSCHGQDGKGETDKGRKLKARDMTTAEYQKATDAQFLKAINEGVQAQDGRGEMDGYADDLKPGEAEALVAYIRELGGKK
jgi:mono/diheme cytochrome c family protein